MLEVRKHSNLGLASTFISIFSWTIVISLILFFGYLEEFTPGGIDAVEETSPTAIIIIILFLGSMLFNLLALVLGIVGLVESERKKLLCISGIIISTLLFALTAIAIIFGSAVK